MGLLFEVEMGYHKGSEDLLVIFIDIGVIYLS